MASLRLALVLLLGAVLVACQAAGAVPSAAELQGSWRVETIGGEPTVSESRASLTFLESELSGNASCNRFFGSYRYDDGELFIDPELAGTKMMCSPSVMAQENEFLALLPQAIRVAISGDVLQLMDGDGQVLISAKRAEEKQ
ncbi:META domain-containing protein [Marinimicrobium sp. ABcell2]|uniref:META domain-containing protein n=1 Tax=Marinimicrobium sp. ABcell2 TaxID=3069751 RepID=UPI0027B123A5|nr:META domain-containing protein [Marinimicrobium sp. ABcell2]MDQ2075686.1 META domain-containing protein [Marinimicrobium sp. ABcell2]